jgi:hypothetical protein
MMRMALQERRASIADLGSCAVAEYSNHDDRRQPSANATDRPHQVIIYGIPALVGGMWALFLALI